MDMITWPSVLGHKKTALFTEGNCSVVSSSIYLSIYLITLLYNTPGSYRREGEDIVPVDNTELNVPDFCMIKLSFESEGKYSLHYHLQLVANYLIILFPI